jgi:tripeptide aminopeptidase|tara:strand:+ start:2753 stop:3847 length:1095 start_codon:yes stop_codon:yes gene_type:complete
MKHEKGLKNRLKEVLSTQATSYDYLSTIEYLIDEVTNLGASVEIDDYDNLYVTKGIAEVYPCVVAHTDTVHDIYKGYKVYDVNGNFVAFDSHEMKQVGTGGDDKVGIWVCLEMLKTFDNIKICFFAQEEIGCVGSSKADAEFFKDVGYVFQCDRKGNSDFVQESSGIEMFGEKFTELITPTLTEHGYTITDGGLTDVHEISQIANVCCANMSCGYYLPHSSREYVNIDDAINTMEMVKSLIKTLGEVRHDYKAKDTYINWGYTTYNHYGSYGTVVKQATNYHKPIKKVAVSSSEFDGCDLCGEISTNGCNHCTQEEPMQDTYLAAKKCSCGEELRVYGSGVNKYHHCYSCGFYEDALTLNNEVL